MKFAIMPWSRPVLQRSSLAVLAIGFLLLGTLPSFAGVGLTSTRTGKPDQRRGTGSRGASSCWVDDKKTSAALVPERNVALTLSAYPRLIWAMPALQKADVKVRVTDTTAKLVHETSFPAARTAGILNLQVPDALGLQPLAIGGTYNWSVNILCDAFSPDTGRKFTTQIQRVATSPALAKSLAQVQGLERVSLLARNGIWVDALAELVDLRCQDPKNPKIQQAWSDLLKSVALEEAVPLPLLGATCKASL